MLQSFDISLPSIPTKNIRFKHINEQKAAFGTERTRFPQNRTLLKKQLIQSFSNLYQSPPKVEDEPKKPTLTSIEREEVSFRSHIPSHKKNLISKFHQVQSTELKSPSPETTKGYLFRKEKRKSLTFEKSTESVQIENPQKVTDNHYFGIERQRGEVKPRKLPRPSAFFRNQGRQAMNQSIISRSVSPGPGMYLPKEDQPLKKQSQEKEEKNKTLNPRYLVQLLYKEEEQTKKEAKEKEKRELNDHMFVVDDRDRFGQQKFPISSKLNVPGPGSYNIEDGIENRAKKAKILQEQRKILKQWFNA